MYVKLTGPSRDTAGPGKPLLRGPITTSFRRRRDRDAEGVDSVEREETWGRVSPHHPTRGLGKRRKLPDGSGAEPRPKMDFMQVSGQKEAIWNASF